MRFLAVDAGDKRTGFAAGDDVLRIATPLEVAEASTREMVLAAVARITTSHGPDAIVLGLPLHMDGTESARSAAARDLAREIAARTGLPVHLQDERLTSFDAEDRMKQSGRSRGQKKSVRDALAACAILEDFLQQRATNG